MQRLEVSGAVRLIYRSLGVKGLNEARSTVTVDGCPQMTPLQNLGRLTTKFGNFTPQYGPVISK